MNIFFSPFLFTSLPCINLIVSPLLHSSLTCAYLIVLHCLPLHSVASRDGLNRLPMEFTLARYHAGKLPSSSSSAPRTEGAGLANQGECVTIVITYVMTFGIAEDFTAL